MANAVAKPVPSERGKAKDAHKPRSVSQKWKTRERADSQWLRDHDGPDPMMVHVATSTGRLGHISYLGIDTSSLHYLGESKARTLPKWIVDAWIQINQKAVERQDRSPVLFMHPSGDNDTSFMCLGKSYRLPVMHIITPERHRFLLECERIVEGNDA
jgi:hypothetical protein